MFFVTKHFQQVQPYFLISPWSYLHQSDSYKLQNYVYLWTIFDFAFFWASPSFMKSCDNKQYPFIALHEIIESYTQLVLFSSVFSFLLAIQIPFFVHFSSIKYVFLFSRHEGRNQNYLTFSKQKHSTGFILLWLLY